MGLDAIQVGWGIVHLMMLKLLSKTIVAPKAILDWIGRKYLDGAMLRAPLALIISFEGDSTVLSAPNNSPSAVDCTKNDNNNITVSFLPWLPALNIWLYEGLGWNKKFEVWQKPKISKTWEKLLWTPHWEAASIGCKFSSSAHISPSALSTRLGRKKITETLRKMGGATKDAGVCIYKHMKKIILKVSSIFCKPTECDKGGRATFKARSVNLYGKGRGRSSQFLFPVFGSFFFCA